MKYIKLFEDVEDKGYKEITEEEYENNRRRKTHGLFVGMDAFDNDDIRIITEFCKDFNARILMRGPSMVINLADGKTSLMMYKTNDDWFFVKVRHPDKEQEPHYSCDQIDSLLRLFDDVIFE
jgi:hypothetical protein